MAPFHHSPPPSNGNHQLPPWPTYTTGDDDDAMYRSCIVSGIRTDPHYMPLDKARCGITGKALSKDQAAVGTLYIGWFGNPPAMYLSREAYEEGHEGLRFQAGGILHNELEEAKQDLVDYGRTPAVHGAKILRYRLQRMVSYAELLCGPIYIPGQPRDPIIAELLPNGEA